MQAGDLNRKLNRIPITLVQAPTHSRASYCERNEETTPWEKKRSFTW